MNRFLISAAIVLLSVSAIAQKGLYIGYENGIKNDYYDYIDEEARNYNHRSMNGVWGAYVGYKYHSYSVEAGFYGYYLSFPDLQYDSVTGIPTHQTSGSSGNSGMDKWVIPVRIGKEFTFCKSRLFLKPEAGFLTMISREYHADHYTGTSGYGFRLPWLVDQTPSRDSLRVNHYLNSRLNFALEGSISGGVRIKKHFDVYLKTSFIAGFSNTLYNTLAYDSPYKHIKAVSTTRNSVIYQVGVRYNF